MSISDQIKTEPDAYKMRNLIAEGIKENKDISDSANSTAQEAKDTADNANNRVNNIISGQIEGKDQEILDAHYSNVTGQTSANIGSRMDGFDSQLADIMQIDANEPQSFNKNTLWCQITGGNPVNFNTGDGIMVSNAISSPTPPSDTNSLWFDEE